MGTTSSLSQADRYVAVHDSARFQTLRRKAHTFTAWASVIFTGWWFLMILLAAYTPGFFRQEVPGNLNVGLFLLLLTFAMVIAITGWYLRYARTVLDPVADVIRADVEGGAR
jgi:uncharacterized membrane protein (DUF485 family)